MIAVDRMRTIKGVAAVGPASLRIWSSSPASSQIPAHPGHSSI